MPTKQQASVDVLEGDLAIGQFMGLPGNHLKYHKRWDYLMPVCKKIKEIVPEMEKFGEALSYVWDIYASMHHFDIEKTYPTVIKFINWYNTQNKQS